MPIVYVCIMLIIVVRKQSIYTDGSTEDTVRLVQSLDQDNLPQQYRSSVCPELDLLGQPINTPAPPKPDAGVTAKPLSIYIGVFFITLVPLALVNII